MHLTNKSVSGLLSGPRAAIYIPIFSLLVSDVGSLACSAYAAAAALAQDRLVSEGLKVSSVFLYFALRPARLG